MHIIYTRIFKYANINIVCNTRPKYICVFIHSYMYISTSIATYLIWLYTQTCLYLRIGIPVFICQYILDLYICAQSVHIVYLFQYASIRYVCTWTYTYICIYIYIYTYFYVHGYIHKYICIYVYVCMYVCPRQHTQGCVCICARVHPLIKPDKYA